MIVDISTSAAEILVAGISACQLLPQLSGRTRLTEGHNIILSSLLFSPLVPEFVPRLSLSTLLVFALAYSGLRL